MITRGAMMAIDKGVSALGSRYPPLKVAGPLAKIATKPLVIMAHHMKSENRRE